MIDLHSHILFETDDGSKTIEESIKMAKEAEVKGYSTMKKAGAKRLCFFVVSQESRLKLFCPFSGRRPA